MEKPSGKIFESRAKRGFLDLNGVNFTRVKGTKNTLYFVIKGAHLFSFKPLEILVTTVRFSQVKIFLP